MLYMFKPHHGVITVLTGDAYLAYCQSLELGRSGRVGILDSKLNERIVAGTLTFVDAARYFGKVYTLPSGKSLSSLDLHSGTTTLMDELFEAYGVSRVDCTYPTPFSSSDPEIFREELAKGFGPKLSLVQTLASDLSKDSLGRLHLRRAITLRPAEAA